MFKRISALPLHWQILIALVLAVPAGWLAGTDSGIGTVTYYRMFDFVGTIFLQALKMIIVPLVVSSIIVGVAGIGSGKNLGRIGGITVLFYLISSTVAILAGLFWVNLIKPGLSGGEPVGDALGFGQSAGAVRDRIGEGGDMGDIADIFIRMVPSNVVDAASTNSELLAVIFFAILFGVFLARSDHEDADLLKRFWNGVFHVMMGITKLVMAVAPIGVFGLVASVIAEMAGDWEQFRDAATSLVVFSGTVLLALATHLLITQPLVISLIGRVRPYAMHRAMAPAMLTAFSTASSSATLPVTIECVTQNVGVSDRTTSFVLPLGATVNMDGTALYECTAAMFIAQAYGLQLDFLTQFVIVITALVTSIGVAGIPSASLVAIGIILTAVGLPLEALGVLFVFDRILDMCRTAVNVFGDSVGALVVARLDGEEGLLEPRPEGSV